MIRRVKRVAGFPPAHVSRTGMGLFDTAMKNAAKLLPWLNSRPSAAARVAVKPPVSGLSRAELMNLSSRPVSELSVQQLEEMGAVYYKGIDGVFPPNVSKAVEAWSQAGRLGSVDSVYYKALCVRSGNGAEKNSTQAFQELLGLANDHNHARSHYALGVMYLSGEGVARSDEMSFEHFKKAAVGGVLPAYHNLANAHAEGKGTPKDEAEALKCYRAAAESGDPSAKFTLGTWYYRGLGGLEVDKKKSFDLQLDAAKSGHGLAAYNVGSAYLSGDGIFKNEKLAVVWLERAADMKIPQGIINLGNMYRWGVGVEKDLKKSREIFQRLSDAALRQEFLKEIDEEEKQN